MDHGDHDHTHDQGGGHAHNEEVVDELLTVGICGAFGSVAIILAAQAVSGTGMLIRAKLLDAKFFYWLLAGGIVLLGLALIRAAVLWKKAGHVHTDDCHHDHDHDHDHADHAHGGAPWKTVVLIFPLLLFFLGVPTKGFSDAYKRRMVGLDTVLSEAEMAQGVEVKNNEIAATFEDIANALRRTEIMTEMTGMNVTVRGQYLETNERQFRLFTTKMTCCASDQVPLKAKIIVADGSIANKSLKDFDWLQVKGVIQFVKISGKDEYLPVIRTKLANIEPTTPDN